MSSLEKEKVFKNYRKKYIEQFTTSEPTKYIGDNFSYKVGDITYSYYKESDDTFTETTSDSSSTKRGLTFYEILTTEHWLYLVNKGDDYFSDKNFILTSDLDFGNSSIGKINNNKGIFFGNNKTITGFKIKLLNENNVGLIGTNYGTIANLNIGDGNTITGNSRVGGVCGDNTSTLTNITVGDGNTITGNVQVGGVCGENWGILTNITVGNNNTITCNDDVGGVCGDNLSRGDKTSSLTNITVGNNNTITGNIRVGGVCGYNFIGTLTNITVGDNNTITGNSRVGGTCGINRGHLTNITVGNYNTITCNEDVGGVCGNIFSGEHYRAILTNITVGNNNTITGNIKVGGVSGYNYNAILTNITVGNNNIVVGNFRNNKGIPNGVTIYSNIGSDIDVFYKFSLEYISKNIYNNSSPPISFNSKYIYLFLIKKDNKYILNCDNKLHNYFYKNHKKLPPIPATSYTGNDTISPEFLEYKIIRKYDNIIFSTSHSDKIKKKRFNMFLIIIFSIIIILVGLII